MKGEGKGLMISLGDSYVRLELMHLLSIVVGGVSFCEYTRPKKEAIHLLYREYTVDILSATRHDIRSTMTYIIVR